MFSQFRGKDKNDEKDKKNTNNNSKEKQNANSKDQHNKERDAKGTDNKQQTLKSDKEQTTNKESGRDTNNTLTQKNKDAYNKDPFQSQVKNSGGNGQAQYNMPSKGKYSPDDKYNAFDARNPGDRQPDERNDRRYDRQLGSNEHDRSGYKSHGDGGGITTSNDRNKDAARRDKEDRQGYRDTRGHGEARRVDIGDAARKYGEQRGIFPHENSGDYPSGQNSIHRPQNDSQVTGIILIASEDKLRRQHNRYYSEVEKDKFYGGDERKRYEDDGGNRFPASDNRDKLRPDSRTPPKEGKGGHEKRQYSLPAADYSGKYSGDVPAAGKPGPAIAEGDPGTGRKKFQGKYNDSSAVFDSLQPAAQKTYRAGTPYKSQDSGGSFESAGGDRHASDKSSGNRKQEGNKHRGDKHGNTRSKSKRSGSAGSSSDEELQDDVEKELREIKEKEKQKSREKRSKEMLGQVGKNSSSTSSSDSVTKKLTEGFSKLGKK